MQRTHKVKATCPAHEDGTASLAVDYKPLERKTLIRCHADCRPEDVTAAVGMTLADLYDDPMPEEKKTRRSIPRARRAPIKRAPAQKSAPKKPSCSGKFIEVERYAYRRADDDRTVAGRKIRKECSGCELCQAEGRKPEKRISWERPKQTGIGWEPRMPENPPLYRAPELAAAPAGSTVYLGEGERVVKAAESLGLLATTKPGSASTRWNPEHTPLLAGKHVVVLADRDAPGYQSARDARNALLADVLSVSVLQTPVEEKGADLVEHIAAGLGLDDLVPVPELDDAEVLTHPTATAQPASEQGEPILGDDGRPNRRDQYAIRHGEIVKVTRRAVGTDGDDQPVYETTFDTVLGCAATIVRVETRDIGDTKADRPNLRASPRPDDHEHDQADDVTDQHPTTGYVLELVHPKHLDQPVLMRVTRKAFDDGSWLHDLPWPDVYYRGNRTALAQICSAIRAVSPDAVRVPVYAATGWRRTEAGAWMYVHADGGITAGGSVPLHTRFPGRLSLMGLPAPVTDPARIREAAMASLSIPAKSPEFAAVAMLGLAFRAPYYRCPSSICLTGLPGSGKTGVGTIVLRHFAPDLDRNESLLSISDTGSTQLGTTEVLYRMKDALVMGDDSAPDRSVRDAAVRTSRMGRTQYNGEGRIRLKQIDGELELDDQRGPRGSLIQTSEVLASTESAQQRMLTIQLSRAEVDIDQLAQMSDPAFAHSCALLMASYIQWIASDYEAHCRTVRRLADTYASHLRPYCGDRPAEHLGQFATGWHMLLRYLTEVGAATAEETAAWWGTAWSALLDACDRERNLLENQTMHKRLLGYLATAFNGRHAHLVGPDGKCPADPNQALRYGWSVVDNSAEDPANPGRPVLRAGGTQLGVVTSATQPDGTVQERLWLDHQQATRIALRMAAELQETFTVTANVLTDALRQAGTIEVEYEAVKNGRWVKARRPMPGGRRRVWDMPATALDVDGGGDGPAEQSGPPRPPAPPAPQADPLFDLSALTAPSSAPMGAPATPAPQAPVVPPAASIPEPAPAQVVVGDVPEPPEPQAVEELQLPVADEDQDVEDRDQVLLPTAEVEGLVDAAASVAAVEDEEQRPELVTTPWRAAAAVAHTDGLYLPDGTVLALPPLEELHAGRFAEMIEDLGLGHGGWARGTGPSRHWRPDDGQIYLSAELTEALGLPVPEDGPASERKAFLTQHADHPFLARARAEGWNVANWGTPTRIWRERPGSSRNISGQLVVVPHVALTTRFMEDDPAPAVLASRLQQLADTIGITFRTTPGVTGHELLRATRPEKGRRAAPLARAEMPPILMERRNLYVAKVWDRQPTKEELLMRYVLLFDSRASYLSVCGALNVGRGPVEHRTTPVFDPNMPGLWLARAPEGAHWGTFDVFGPRKDDGSPRWYATPTLAYAQKDLKADVEVSEAWVWPDYYRMLEPWYKQLRTARQALVSSADPLVAATLKDTYTNSIGLFNSDHLRGDPSAGTADSMTFRPDIQQAIVAAQQANLTRTIMRVGNEHGMWPIAVKTDMLAYVTDDPNFFTAVPGLKMENDLGNFKPEGAALAADIFAHLRPGRGWFPTASAFTSAEEWGEN
ncbi:hypothetical protein [Streptomyces sp. NPDC001205]